MYSIVTNREISWMYPRESTIAAFRILMIFNTVVL